MVGNFILKVMNLQGVNVVLFAVIVIAAGFAIATTRTRQNQIPKVSTPSPAVAGESLHVSTTVSQVQAPPTSPTTAPTLAPKVFGTSVLIVTPSPTPTPTPTKQVEGNWTVSDSGEGSNPRTAEISYESHDNNSNANIRVHQSTSASGNTHQSTNLKVTVNGETREIKD